MGKRILVVDDEKLIVKGIRFALLQEGMDVDIAYDGAEAVRKATTGNYDMILLDLMLPIMNGYEVCQQIRETSDVPIIMLTAKGEDMDKIMGLEYGADDYMTKPFNILELKARIKAIWRRAKRIDHNIEVENRPIAVAGLTLDVKGHNIIVDGEAISLTVKEYDLLKILMENAGKVFMRDDLLNQVWGIDYPGDNRTVDVYIRRIREKIEKIPAKPAHIMTKWGVGYYFES